MILTNVVLSVGFMLISNFAQTIHLSRELVPKSTEDLSSIHVGDPHSQVDLYVTTRNGIMFGIRDGAVTMFEAPGSLKHLQEPELLPRFAGDAKFGSNVVTEFAVRTLEKLVRGTNPIANVKPFVSNNAQFRGHALPYYNIKWPKPKQEAGFGYFAAIEVDARDGRVTALELHDPNFCDYSLAHEIRAKAFIADPERAKPASETKRIYPRPTEAEVEKAIKSWKWLCRQLGIKTGINTEVSEVNWDRTCVFTNDHMLSSTDGVCRVEFKSGAWFVSTAGICYSHHASDSCFSGDSPHRTAGEQHRFEGKINYRWQDLAKELEKSLTSGIGIPSEYIMRYAPHAGSKEDEINAVATNKRVLVLWCLPENWSFQGFGAEFDRESGELKDIGFTDPMIIGSLGKIQGLNK